MYIGLHIIITNVWFFSELSNSLNQITNNYDNLIVMGDLNIGILHNTKGHYNYLSNLYDTFSLNNLIKRENLL